LIRRALVAALVSLLLAGCTGLIFQPLSQHLLTPDRLGLAYRDIRFTAADGVSLHGWFLPATAPRQGSVLFLHGNAQNISTHIASVAWLPGAGFDVFLFDYRGYGRSAGEPSLDGVHLDFSAAPRLGSIRTGSRSSARASAPRSRSSASPTPGRRARSARWWSRARSSAIARSRGRSSRASGRPGSCSGRSA
jgi:fermentation-respiration switch protein FrsA (DUF1100 family)